MSFITTFSKFKSSQSHHVNCNKHRGAIENNEKLRTQFSSAVSTTLSDVDSSNREIISSIDSKLS